MIIHRWFKLRDKVLNVLYNFLQAYILEKEQQAFYILPQSYFLKTDSTILEEMEETSVRLTEFTV